jgi:hypothetical protein
MKRISKIMFGNVILSVFVIFCFASVALAIEAPSPGTAVIAKKPDLIVENISFSKITDEPTRVQVEISVTVKNQIKLPAQCASTAASLTAEGRARACAGAFKVLLEWSDNPPAGFNRLGEAGMTALNCGESKTVKFTQWVAKGTSRKYRATADHLNWINEWDEGNNINSAGYIAR